MTNDKAVHIDVDLPPAEAMALAQFVKCVTWSAMRECSVDEAECFGSAQRATKCSGLWQRRLRSALSESLNRANGPS